MTKKVDTAADLAKAFGIFLVVTGHTIRGLFNARVLPESPLWVSADSMIYLFHMPLFFYISGLFFESSLNRYGLLGLLKRNVVTLLLPMTIWSYIQYTLQYFSPGSANMHVDITYVLLAVIPPKQQFWFLGALFVIMVFIGMIMKIKNVKPLLWMLLVTLFLLLSGNRSSLLATMIGNPVIGFFGQIFMHLPYFILGILVTSEKITETRVSTKTCMLMFAASLWTYCNISLAKNATAVAASVICVLAIYKICKNIEGLERGYIKSWFFSWVTFIGMNSMIIYLTQVILSAAARSTLLKANVLNAQLHLTLGILVGLFCPLLLVPIGMKLSGISPTLAQGLLPVRLKRNTATQYV